MQKIMMCSKRVLVGTGVGNSNHAYSWELGLFGGFESEDIWTIFLRNIYVEE